MHGSIRATALAVTGLALLAGPAAGGSRPRADFAMDFSTKRPNAGTTIHLKILYKGPDPRAKPSPSFSIIPVKSSVGRVAITSQAMTMYSSPRVTKPKRASHWNLLSFARSPATIRTTPKPAPAVQPSFDARARP